MKPITLEFCGINSFSEPAVIDFNRLLEFGLFGVFGDTGSGKSTILDSIGFALYGNVSRSRSGSIAEIINYGSERAYVIYEFEIVFEGKRRRFRIERELKKKNAVQSVKVYEKEGDALRVLSDGVRDSNALLEKIIGLEQKDFEKCIALPQGEFAQFVKAQRSDRLKLVSRLFDLEEYGEKLVKKANAQCAQLTGERNILFARLEPYAEISEEGNRVTKEEIAAIENKERGEREALVAARAEENRLSVQLGKKKEAIETERRLEKLESKKSEIDLLERELSRIESAQVVVRAAQERKSASEILVAAEKIFSAAQSAKRNAEDAEKKFEGFDEERDDEEISKLTEMKAKAEQSEEMGRRIAELTKRLQAARRAYAEEAENFKGFSYEEEKSVIEERLNALGSGDFLSYAEEHGKASLLHAEYDRFTADLTHIHNKYPETEEDILPLIQKYGSLSAGEKVDFSELKSTFEAQERARSIERERLLALEKKNGLYRAHRERLQQLQTEGFRIKEELSEFEKSAVVGEKLSRAQIEKELLERRRAKKMMLEARERARKELSRTTASLAAAEEKCSAAQMSAKSAEVRLREALVAGNFENISDAQALFERFGSKSDTQARITSFREEYAALLAKKRELQTEDLESVTEEVVLAAKEKLFVLEKEHELSVRTLAVKRDELVRKEEALVKKGELEKELSRINHKTELSERLKKLLEGNKFMEFAAEEYLQSVARSGSRRLLQLTGGRYFLRYDGGFLVGDNLGGGKLRGVYTLSGGETFLVSLSLALALSAEICAKSLRPIEFFFLDEGFGTLDERLVDIVMDSLEKLKSEHLSIGVISHVEELKHRIERKLSVEKATEKHGSRIIGN